MACSGPVCATTLLLQDSGAKVGCNIAVVTM